MSLVWRSRLGYLSDFCVAAVIAALIWLVLSSCLGCGFAKDVGGEVGGTLAEFIACPTDLIDCGQVLMFAAEADNELGHVELCVDVDDHPEDVEAAEELFGPSEPTPRHQGLCWWQCGPDAHKGANAFNGAFCPERP